jgi:hypothetical protein
MHTILVQRHRYLMKLHKEMSTFMSTQDTELMETYITETRRERASFKPHTDAQAQTDPQAAAKAWEQHSDHCLCLVAAQSVLCNKPIRLCYGPDSDADPNRSYASHAAAMRELCMKRYVKS